MDRADVSILAHRHHPIAAPIPDDVVSRLLARVAPDAGASVLDLGCGRGEWLRRLVAVRPDVQGTGVDVVPHQRYPGLDDLDDALHWQTADAATWAGPPADAVLIVGAWHVFDGLRGTLRAAHRALRQGGGLLLGDAFSETEPPVAVQDALGYGAAALPDLPGMIGAITEERFEILDAHVSTARDWAEYEWSWTGSLID